VFDQFLRLCAAAGPESCSLARLGRPATVARHTLDALKRKPVVLDAEPGPVEFTYQQTVAVIYSYLYAPAAWGELADLMFLLTVGGQAQAVAAGRLSAERVAAAVALGRPGKDDYRSVGGSLGSTCADVRTPRRSVYPAAADAENRRFPDFGRYRTWADFGCSYLRAAGIRDDDAYTGPWRQTTSAHVLVLGTRWDPATPYRNTRPYADLFRHASVVTLAGWGHTTLGQSGCTDARVAAYLLNPRRDRGDTTCATEIVLFTAAPVSGAAAERRTASLQLTGLPR
jgi:hypothetical protein